MASKPTSQTSRGSAARIVRDRVARGGARYWKHSDFQGLPPAAVATALSRLAREGQLDRVSKGVYYHAVPTSFGMSVPSPSAAAAQTLRAPVHPAGLSAANALGLTTQNPRRPEFATPAPGPPTALHDAIIHTGRPAQRAGLSAEDGAILEILRERAAQATSHQRRPSHDSSGCSPSEDRFRAPGVRRARRAAAGSGDARRPRPGAELPDAAR